MRISGTEAKRLGTGKVRLRQADGAVLELKVRAFPLGFDANERFQIPPPPRIKARRTNGEIERDAAGKVVWDHNEQDPQWRAQRDRIARVRQACQFAAATVRGDGAGEVRFDTQLQADDEECYLALWDELRLAGFSGGDLLAVVYKAKELGTMTDKALEDAMADFSQEESSQQPSAPVAEA
jgi:hypothetical protein